jgi:hypothetical protein
MSHEGKSRPEILLKTDNKTVVLELERDGKFVAKSAPWEDNKVMLPGERLHLQIVDGQWGDRQAAGDAGGVAVRATVGPG